MTTPATGEAISDWTLYKRVGEIEAREWTRAEASGFSVGIRTNISVSNADKVRATFKGGYVARNPANHADQWYIAPDYFAKNYAPSPPPAGLCPQTATPSKAGLEQFIVKHYTSDERPIIKGNGFDGLEVGETREDAQEFVDWINARLAGGEES